MNYSKKENSVSNNNANRNLLTLLKKMRNYADFNEFDHNQIARHDIRIGHINGKKLERFIIHFRSNGCHWCKKTGGCIMCGFWNETTRGKKIVTSEEFVNQFKNAINRFELKKYNSLCLYNAGSMLQENEISFSAVKNIFLLIAEKLENLKQLTIESRAEYITKEKLQTLQKIIGKNVQLAIGIGFESHNDTVRNMIINKGISKKEFEKCIELMNSLNIRSVVNLVIKPPFLTEQEAIDDIIKSTKYLSGLGVSEIHYETMTVEDHTLVSLLYEKGIYNLPWLWSIIEILKRVRHFSTPFLTPLNYITKALDTPKNCPICTELVTKKIYENYCSDFNISHFENLNCNCKTEWQRIIQKENTLSLEERISQCSSICN